MYSHKVSSNDNDGGTNSHEVTNHRPNIVSNCYSYGCVVRCVCVNCFDNTVQHGNVTEDIEDIVKQLDEGDDPRGRLETENTKTSLLVVRHLATVLWSGGGGWLIAGHGMV